MLKNSAFRTLWSAHTLALLGTNTSLVVIPLLALSVTGASVLQMGLLEASESLAVLLFGLFIGVFADRISGRSAMLIANIVRAIALLTIPAAYFFAELSFIHVFLVVFVIGAGSLLYQASLSKQVITTFPRKDWPAVNSLMEGSSSVTEVGGPGIGGVLVQIFGAPIAVILDAISYISSSFLLIRSNSKNDFSNSLPEDSHESAGKVLKNEKNAFLAGVRFLFSNKIMRYITMAAAHFNFFTAVFFGVYTFYLVRELGFEPLLIGLASVVGGFGGVASAAITSRLMSRAPTTLLFVISLSVPAIAAVLVPVAGLTDSKIVAFSLVALSQFAWSFAIVVNLVMSESIKQMLTPFESIGRVSSAIRWVSLGVEPLGAVAGGIIATFFSPTTALVVGAFGLITSIFWLLPRQGIRSFDLRLALSSEDDAVTPSPTS